MLASGNPCRRLTAMKAELMSTVNKHRPLTVYHELNHPGFQEDVKIKAKPLHAQVVVFMSLIEAT